MKSEESATAMKERCVYIIMRRILLCAAFFILHALFFISPAGAQGFPLIRNYTAEEYGGHNRNYDVEEGEDGTIFVANFEGLLYYDRARWRIIHTPGINRVTVCVRDSKNAMWVGGYKYFGRVQLRANGELFLQQVAKDGLFDGEVKEIFEDEGSLQFVASDNNIYEVTETESPSPIVKLKKHTNARFNIGVESNVVSVEALKAGKENALMEDIIQTEKLDDGLIVKVKENMGLIIADDQGNDLFTITEANGLCSNQVSYVAYDRHGTLWGATAHGIFSIEIPSLYSYFLPKDGLTGEVHSIIAYGGKVYVGTTNGLFTVAQRQCKRVDRIDNICWALSQQGDALLAATSSGIYKITRDGAVSRLTSNATTAMLVEDDTVYVAEPDGVWLYQSGRRTKVDNLPLVTEIRKGAHGKLWLQNVHGETKGADPGKRKMPIDALAKQLLKPVSDIDAKAQYRYGYQIWIGGDEILAIVNTEKQDLAKLTECRTVRFRSIVMRGDSVLWGGFGDMPKTLPTLSSNEGHLHFFYALDYAPLSGKTLYRFRMDEKSLFGSEGRWSSWSEKQDVAFLNLRYGSYTFSVQAMSSSGELSEVASVDFKVAYPLLMRWYMVVLYFFLFAYIVYQLFRYRLRRLQKDKIKLERIVEERTADLRNAQHELIRQEKMATVGKLTEGLIDRILNPMNYIINFSKMSNDLLKDLKENIDNNKDNINEDDYEDTLDVLDMLSDNLKNVDQYGQNTTRTLKAMEEMLKDRTGGYVDMDLLPVLQQNEKMVNTYFAKEKEQYHIQFVFNLPNSAMPLHGNPEMLSKTMMSLLGNAVYAVTKKYEKQPYSPEVSLTVTVTRDQYILKIRDNGTGIGDTTLNKIFDPFFTTKTTAEAAGVGLYLSREIIQNHNGDISVESVKDNFTEFTISLPKSKSV